MACYLWFSFWVCTNIIIIRLLVLPAKLNTTYRDKERNTVFEIIIFNAFSLAYTDQV